MATPSVDTEEQINGKILSLLEGDLALQILNGQIMALLEGRTIPQKIVALRLIRASLIDPDEHGDGAMDAFLAYLRVRRVGKPVPEWVLEFLDLSIGAFWEAYAAYGRGEGRNQPARALAEAFRVKGGGRGTVWSKWKDVRWLHIGLHVQWSILDQGNTKKGFTEENAIKDACNEYNREHQSSSISFETARDDWQRFKREFPDIVAYTFQFAF